MKKLYTIIIAILLTTSILAQSPEKMSYQAVIRNSSDELVTNQTVGMQISILQGSANGTPVYVETQTPTTNTNGLVSIEIGSTNATIVSGDFSTIDWANSSYFIKTETDPTGGTSYTITGTSQLLSVPYALHAKTAETVTGEITVTETDPTFTAWDKTTGISITESQVSDINHFTNSDETDPIYTQSVASGITATDTSNWNSGQGSFTETDPIYSNSQASNITSTDITNLSNLSGINSGDQDLSGKVDRVSGKELSTNDYTDTDKTKLTGIETGAEVNVNADWNATSGDSQILNKPTTITSTQASEIETNNAKNSYPTVDAIKLSGIETGAEVNVNADWNSTIGDSQILNKPDLSNYAEQSNVLQLDNTTTFTPDADYEPATKKYVDEKVSSSGTQHYIGEEFGGGVVFYVDRTGEHGLIVSTTNVSTAARFGTNTTTGANNRHNGQFNTNLLDNSALADAAYKVNEYNGGGYTDWYIPAIDELALLFYARYNVSKALESISGSDDLNFPVYWSSTEVDADEAYNYSTKYEKIEIRGDFNTSKGTLLGVRAIRAF